MTSETRTIPMLILIRNRPLPPFQQEAICNQKRTKREIYQNEKKFLLY